MNQESIDQMTRHIKDVPRIEARLAELTPEEIDQLVTEKQSTASIRWAQCRRSFQMLFMIMSRGNKLPVDSFEVKLSSEQIGSDTVDVCARVWRDRRDGTFNVRPFTRNGHVEDRSFATETFGDTFNYRYGTHLSKSATLEVDHDDPDTLIHLTRVEGKLVDETTPQNKAIYLSALESLVMPSLDDIQDTLMLVSEAARDPELNPDHAEKYRLRRR